MGILPTRVFYRIEVYKKKYLVFAWQCGQSKNVNNDKKYAPSHPPTPQKKRKKRNKKHLYLSDTTTDLDTNEQTDRNLSWSRSETCTVWLEQKIFHWHDFTLVAELKEMKRDPCLGSSLTCTRVWHRWGRMYSFKRCFPLSTRPHSVARFICLTYNT